MFQSNPLRFRNVRRDEFHSLKPKKSRNPSCIQPHLTSNYNLDCIICIYLIMNVILHVTVHVFNYTVTFSNLKPAQNHQYLEPSLIQSW